MPRKKAFNLILGGLLVVAMFAAALAAQQNSPDQPSGSARNNTLNVTVTDRDHHLISGLKAENFKLYIEGQSQPISSVSAPDASTCMGLVVDTSGSMRPKHGNVVKALLDLVSTANPQGQTFVVNFNDGSYLDQDLTRSLDLIREALNRGDPRGGTALYDTVFAAADHVAGAKQCERRLLVLATDGEDNESRVSLESTIREAQQTNGPVIYTILISAEHPRARRAMETLAAATGGRTFSSGGLKQEVKDLAEEIGKQYTISYGAADDRQDGSYRKIRVEAQSAEQGNLLVRARSGYYAGTPSKPVVPPSTPAVKPAGSAATTSAPASAVDQSPTYFNCVTGRVVDENNLPVENITVSATPQNGTTQSPNSSSAKSIFARTGHDGAFRFTRIPPGPYRLSTFNFSAGYPSTAIPLYGSGRTQEISVSAAQGCSDVVLNAGPKAARLRLKVLESGTGNQVTTFSVILRREDIPGSPITIRGDPDHDLLLPPLAEVTLQVQAPGYTRSDGQVVKSGPSDTSQELTVELRPAFPRL